MSVPILEGRDLRVVYGRQEVLNVPLAEVREGEVLAIIGPNGAGKSTLLRVLGLLEATTEGTVLYRGQLTSRSGRQGLSIRRRFASVFQEPLLCDTTVWANVALGLRLRGRPTAEVDAAVRIWLERLGISHLADRKSQNLSGGEAQRTSLARAFAIEPEVLLLDEPFSALDPPTRAEFLSLLQELLRQAGCTTIFVTHDREEALQLGDRIAVIIDGHISQVGRPVEVFGRPATEEVARFVGVETVLPAVVAAASDGLLRLRVGDAELIALGERAVGTDVLVSIRAEDVILVREPDGTSGTVSARNHLRGLVVAIEPAGPLQRVRIDCGFPLVAAVTRPALDELALVPGAPVAAIVKAPAVHVIG